MRVIGILLQKKSDFQVTCLDTRTFKTLCYNRSYLFFVDENAGQRTQVPVVTILIEGGAQTIGNVLSSVENGHPVVVMQGSGRAANLLSWAYNESYVLMLINM